MDSKIGVVVCLGGHKIGARYPVFLEDAPFFGRETSFRTFPDLGDLATSAEPFMGPFNPKVSVYLSVFLWTPWTFPTPSFCVSFRICFETQQWNVSFFPIC